MIEQQVMKSDDKTGYYVINKDTIKEYYKQYYVINEYTIKQYKKDYNKQYYDTNKNTIKQYKTQKHQCECGGKYTIQNKSSHLKTKKHKNYIENLSGV